MYEHHWLKYTSENLFTNQSPVEHSYRIWTINCFTTPSDMCAKRKKWWKVLRKVFMPIFFWGKMTFSDLQCYSVLVISLHLLLLLIIKFICPIFNWLLQVDLSLRSRTLWTWWNIYNIPLSKHSVFLQK